MCRHSSNILQDGEVSSFLVHHFASFVSVSISKQKFMIMTTGLFSRSDIIVVGNGLDYFPYPHGISSHKKQRHRKRNLLRVVRPLRLYSLTYSSPLLFFLNS